MRIGTLSAFQLPHPPGSQILSDLIKEIAIGSMLTALLFVAPPAIGVENLWSFGNGQVELSDPMRVASIDLRRPRLLGSGGGGAVFAFDSSDVAIKVSWIKSRDSVRQECIVLKEMEKQQVQGVEQCLGIIPYPPDPRRTMIALKPVMENAVSSVTDIDISLQQHSVECIIRAFVNILASGVATIDVQPLISTETGDVLFIDMTEARLLPKTLSSLDKSFVQSFYVEIMTLIPETYESIASKVFLQELKEHGLSKDIYCVLREDIVSQDILDYIDTRLGS